MRRGMFVLLPILLGLGAAQADAQTSATLVGVSAYGNFHAGGVVATIADDSDQDATLAPEVRRAGAPAFRAAQPLATIQEGANRALPGTLISISPGVYRESVDLAVSGTAAQPIVFRGSAPGAILDGADAAVP